MTTGRGALQGNSCFGLTLRQLETGLADRRRSAKKSEFLLRQSLLKAPWEEQPDGSRGSENEVLKVRRYLAEKFGRARSGYRFVLDVLPRQSSLSPNVQAVIRHEVSPDIPRESLSSLFKTNKPQCISQKIKNELSKLNVKATVSVDVSSETPRIHVIHHEVAFTDHQAALLDWVAEQKLVISSFEKNVKEKIKKG